MSMNSSIYTILYVKISLFTEMIEIYIKVKMICEMIKRFTISEKKELFNEQTYS